MVKSFIVGFIFIFIFTIILFLGLGVYSDARDLGTYEWQLLGMNVFEYEQVQPNGHMLHFGLGILLIALFGGLINFGLSWILKRTVRS